MRRCASLRISNSTFRTRFRPASVPEARQPSKLQDEVRFLGGALNEKVLGVWWRHATLRRSKTRFDSWRGQLICEVNDAGARRSGNRLQSGFKRVRLPPASLTVQLPVRTTSCNDDQCP